MPFEVTDNVTGKTLIFDNEPSEQDMLEAFGSMEPTDTPTDVGQPAQDPEELLFQSEMDNVPRDIPVQEPTVSELLNLPEERRGYLGSVADILENRTKKSRDFLQGSESGSVMDIPVVAGQVVGGIGDILFESAKGALEFVIPDKSEEVLKAVSKNLYERVLLNNPIAMVGQAGIKAGLTQYEKLPTRTKTATDSITNLLLTSTAQQGTKLGWKVAKEATEKSIAKLPVQAKAKLIVDVEKKIDKKVKKGIGGTIGTDGKTASMVDKELKMDALSVKTIINKQGVLKLPSGSKIPTTVEDWSHAIDQAKKSIWGDTIAPLIGATDEAGFRIPVNNSIKNLENILQDNTLIGANGARVKRQAQQLLDGVVDGQGNKISDGLRDVQARGGFTASETQKFVSDTNRASDSLFKNVNPEFDSELGMRVVIANDMKSNLNKFVDNITGEELAPYKLQYKALLQSEQKVTGLMNKVFKESHSNSVSYWDLGTDWGILNGMLTANPTSVFSAASAKGIGWYQKIKRSPDTFTKNMFASADKHVGTQQKILNTIEDMPANAPLRQITFAKPGDPGAATINLGMAERSGKAVRDPNLAPPLTRPSQKALPAPSDIRLGMDDVSGKSVRDPNLAPNLRRPTKKALPAPSDVKLGMADISGQGRSFTKTDSRGRTIAVPEEIVKAEFTNPVFWEKNKDLTNLLIKMEQGVPPTSFEMNEFLNRVLGRIMAKTDRALDKPMKGAKPTGSAVSRPDFTKASPRPLKFISKTTGDTWFQNPRTGVWTKGER